MFSFGFPKKTTVYTSAAAETVQARTLCAKCGANEDGGKKEPFCSEFSQSIQSDSILISRVFSSRDRKLLGSFNNIITFPFRGIIYSIDIMSLCMK